MGRSRVHASETLEAAAFTYGQDYPNHPLPNIPDDLWHNGPGSVPTSLRGRAMFAKIQPIGYCTATSAGSRTHLTQLPG